MVVQPIAVGFPGEVERPCLHHLGLHGGAVGGQDAAEIHLRQRLDDARAADPRDPGGPDRIGERHKAQGKDKRRRRAHPGSYVVIGQTLAAS